jgi:hypothetical protein
MKRGSVREGYCCEWVTVYRRSADLLTPVCTIKVSLPSADFCGLAHSIRLANADSLLSSERSRSSCPYAHAQTHVQSILNTTNTAHVTPQLLYSYRLLLKETVRLNGKYSISMSVLMLTFQNPSSYFIYHKVQY